MSRDLSPAEMFRKAVEDELARDPAGLLLVDSSHRELLDVDVSGPLPRVNGTPVLFTPLGGGAPILLPRDWLAAALATVDGDRLTLPVDWDEAAKTFRVHLPDDASDCKVVAA